MKKRSHNKAFSINEDGLQWAKATIDVQTKKLKNQNKIKRKSQLFNKYIDSSSNDTTQNALP
jgi:hypothetical protein